jgi:hypothetical protein
MNVEAMGEEERRTLLHVGLQVALPNTGLELVRREQHHHVGPFGRLGHVHHLQARLLGLGGGFGAWAQGYGDISDA